MAVGRERGESEKLVQQCWELNLTLSGTDNQHFPGARCGRLHALDGRGAPGPEAREPALPLRRRRLQDHDQRFRTLQDGGFRNHGDCLRNSR